MKNIHQFILTTLSAFSLAGFTTAAIGEEIATKGAEVGKWTQDYEAAAKLADEKKLPMMLNFTGSDWCGWCKLMDKKVFADETWKEYAGENVVLVTIDFPQNKSIVPQEFVARNEKLKNDFGVRGFPTYVVLDSDGETVLGQLGAGEDKTPASFIEEFKMATRLSAGSIDEFKKANPDKADAYGTAIQEFTTAKKALMDWIATEPERSEENNKKFEEFVGKIETAASKIGEFHTDGE